MKRAQLGFVCMRVGNMRKKTGLSHFNLMLVHVLFLSSAKSKIMSKRNFISLKASVDDMKKPKCHPQATVKSLIEISEI